MITFPNKYLAQIAILTIIATILDRTNCKTMRKLFFFGIVAGMMVGCSPRVTSEMLTHEFEPLPTNKVMIEGIMGTGF